MLCIFGKIITKVKLNFVRTRFMSSANTIFALSSAYGKCGVSVIRISGPQTRQAMKAMIGNSWELKERHAYLKALYHPKTKEIIDRSLVLWFPGPYSFTGEDSCEFQVHGSLAVVAAVLDALSNVSGLRPATPGEFTKKAFINNKINLTEVDGLADLIHAETEAQRKQALFQSTGSLSRLYNGWRTRLIRCAAHFEAYIDFAEEENIEADVIARIQNDLHQIITEITEHLNDQRQGEMLRNGVRIVITGAPNVGKSSFLNLMCQKDVSIVTDVAGTTRDVIESSINIGGYPVIFVDTAGLRRLTTDKVELQGILRAKDSTKKADVILIMVDASLLMKENALDAKEFDTYLKKYFEDLDLDADILAKKHTHIVINKTDLLSNAELVKIQRLSKVFHISCNDTKTIKKFLCQFEVLLKDICGVPLPEAPRLTRERYRSHLDQCVKHLKIFLFEYSPDIFPDIAISSEKLRYAIKDIERITGHVSTDDILDVVFKDFCIGK